MVVVGDPRKCKSNRSNSPDFRSKLRRPSHFGRRVQSGRSSPARQTAMHLSRFHRNNNTQRLFVFGLRAVMPSCDHPMCSARERKNIEARGDGRQAVRCAWPLSHITSGRGRWAMGDDIVDDIDDNSEVRECAVFFLFIGVYYQRIN